MASTLDYQEALLALTTIVAWADGENQAAEVDARVQMIVEEKISNDTFDSFKTKYDEINDFEKLFEMALSSLQPLSIEEKGKALAWMWQIANVAKEGVKRSLDHIENIWKKSNNNIDLDELVWINRAKKSLKINLDDFKIAFQKIPNTNRIT